MSNGIYEVKTPVNEPILAYAPGAREKKELKSRLAELKSKEYEIPLIIGGTEIRTGKTGKCIIPHDKKHVLAVYHKAGEPEIRKAIEAALAAKWQWENMPWEHRAAIFLKAAELLAGPWRSTLNAATMLGQSKTAFQAEIDAACELIDFFRFNAYFMRELYKDQPGSTSAYWDRLEYRPLEGFVFAVTPFNFTSIAGNLPSAPAMMGNTVLWKPASTAVYSGYFLMKLFEEAGLPPGVINFIPGTGAQIGEIVLNHTELAGIHFTGSTKVFQQMWKTVGNNIGKYRSYPRIVGETGGKDFIFAHPTADIRALATAMIRGAFEYQGQKCSAASRAFVPRSIWNKLLKILDSEIRTIRMGDTEDFTNFLGAVIDQNSFDNLKSCIETARKSKDAEVVIGGKCDSSKGFFIEPTVILAKDPKFKTMVEEIFGPVLTIYVYADKDYEKTLKLCDAGSPYGLTGAVFARDRYALVQMENALRHAAGNFYLNDKPTGAVVGQQPFGGSRASGTNDKAGSKLNLIRWTSPRAIKELFDPPKAYGYPFMAEK
ncbi:MAG: L-glutamate gamma-semialdehyde dehydrogenase [Candidatus Wallbacteria bacterium]|nr:L-glutamate gamma-semialdehyde dehydrogenase [Candidatus Wallbacteria bacterium]